MPTYQDGQEMQTMNEMGSDAYKSDKSGCCLFWIFDFILYVIGFR